jgi:hypothetical protein
MTDTLNCSDEQLSRLIAEHIEPEPSGHLCSGPPYNVCAADNPYECPACIFRGLERQKKFKYFRFVDRTWRPVDMVNDPACTVMLLEKLIPAEGPAFRLSQTSQFWYVRGEGSSASVATRSTTLGRAVAEAYARAKGLL